MHAIIILLIILVALSRETDLVQNIKKNKSSSFEWIVNSPPTGKHRLAIAECMRIVETTWVSNVTSSVEFTFDDSFAKKDKQILGDSKPSRFVRVGRYNYPIAMAKSILGNKWPRLSDRIANVFFSLMNGYEESDVIVRLNPQTDWYTGIDKNRRAWEYDLVQVCLHEVYHGLLLTGTKIDVENRGNITYAYPTAINDRFRAFVTTRTTEGKYCPIDDYIKDPRMLGDAITNQELYFSTNDARIAKLYTPKKYSSSSIMHLDQKTYGTGENSLMVPYATNIKSNHDVGPIIRITQSILLNATAEPPRSCLRRPRTRRNTFKLVRNWVMIVFLLINAYNFSVQLIRFRIRRVR